MSERNLLFDGSAIYRALLDDLSRVMDHSYDIDEIFKRYVNWCKIGEGSVDDYCWPLFRLPSSSPEEDLEDSRDNHVALRNAMINLYCALDTATPGLDRQTVSHVSFHLDQDESLIITVR